MGTGNGLLKNIQAKGAAAGKDLAGVHPMAQFMEDGLSPSAIKQNEFLNPAERLKYAAASRTLSVLNQSDSPTKTISTPLGDIQLTIDDSVSGQRTVTVGKPANTTFAELFQELKRSNGYTEDGVVPDSYLMYGPAGDSRSSQESNYTFTLHFDMNNMSLAEQEDALAKRGEKPASPFVVALAEAASLAKDGVSLFNANWVRTDPEYAAKKGAIITVLNSDGGGVNDVIGADYVFDTDRLKNLIVAGSPN